MAGTVRRDAQQRRHAALDPCCVESFRSASGLRAMLTIITTTQPVREGSATAFALAAALLSKRRADD